MDEGPILIVFLGIVGLVVLGVAAVQGENQRRKDCAAAGGYYLTGRRVTPVCIDKKYIINMGK
jgi:hypothetical protein